MNFNISFTGTTENSDKQVNKKMLGTLSKSQFSGISEKTKTTENI
jgi:hypothetical protein